jgi:hypothetical protein
MAALGTGGFLLLLGQVAITSHRIPFLSKCVALLQRIWGNDSPHTPTGPGHGSAVFAR